MPHQCTNCGKTFADGSKEMLSGCPDCGGNKFQFRPAGGSQPDSETRVASAPSGDSTPSADEQSDRSGVAGTAAKAGASVREWVENRTGDDDSEVRDASDSDDTDVTIDPDRTTEENASSKASEASESTSDDRVEAIPSAADTEDRAQASARSDVVTPEELSAAQVPSDSTQSDAEGTVIEPESDDRPDLSELRQELNDQFESIKILSPGQYELNLMELYDREEYIISLREDGRYVIEVPDTWRHGTDED